MDGSGGYDLADGETDINSQIQQFNKSLKEEKMAERVERHMNEGSLRLKENEKLFELLKKPEYFRLISGMIGLPNQYQSGTTVTCALPHSV